MFGCTGQHLIANDKNFLGWIAPGRAFTYGGVTRSLRLSALMGGDASGNMIVTIPGVDANNYTTVEMRHRTGFDVRLPGDAVIVHTVDKTRKDPAWVRGTNGAAGAMFTTGQTYTVPTTMTTVRVTSVTGANAVVVISNGVNPAVTSLSTTSGRAGTPVTITGTNLSPEATVTFGATSATSVTGGTGTGLTVVTPALANGTYPITVTNPDGRTATAGTFTVITAVAVAPTARASGPNAGIPAVALPARIAAPTPAATTPTPRPAPIAR